MKAMILAAGRGERLRPLTDHTPKPLLPVAGKPLIVHLIERLRAEGFAELVINLAHLGSCIRTALGDGAGLGVSIQYSDEGSRALETAGGIVQALPLLGSAPFLVVNGDVWTDFPFASLAGQPRGLGHLVLVPNPAYREGGDFGLEDGMVTATELRPFTFSGVGVYGPEFFAGCPAGKRALAPLLYRAVARGQLSGERYEGWWVDVGTMGRLQALRIATDNAPSP